MFRRQNIMPSRIPLFVVLRSALFFSPHQCAPHRPTRRSLVDPATGAVLHAVNAGRSHLAGFTDENDDLVPGVRRPGQRAN